MGQAASRVKVLTAAFIASIALTGVLAGGASATTSTFSNRATIALPGSGTSGPASPYPSNIPVAGLSGGPIEKLTVTLHSFSHTCPSDNEVLLVGPTGAKTILMAYVGGCPQVSPPPAVDLTFDQAATSPIPNAGPLVTGTYKPTAAVTPGPLTPPAPAPPYPLDLNVFNGTAPNGAWSLYADDQGSVDTGTIAGWSLHITAPNNLFTVGAPTRNKKKGTATVPLNLPDSGELAGFGSGATVASSGGAVISRAVGAGPTSLTIKAKGKKKKKLKRKGKVKTSVAITYTPNRGTPATQSLTVKLKKKKKKR